MLILMIGVVVSFAWCAVKEGMSFKDPRGQ
jgi:hypothetical protein